MLTSVHRLVTKTKRTTILLTYERHVFRIDVGNKWRNGFDVRRASNSFMIMACDTGVNGHLQAVFCALETKGRLPPHHASHVIPAEFQIRKSIVHEQIPHLRIRPLALTTCNYYL